MLDDRTHQRRRDLKLHPGNRFVDSEEFRVLAISTRKFWRADDPAAQVRGLFDPLTGEQFLTEEESLFVLGHQP